MANTQSAAKRARTSVRRRSHNRASKARLHTLERNFLGILNEKKLPEASEAFRSLSSALDKSAKTRVIHANNAARKKSRMAARLKTLQPIAE